MNRVLLLCGLIALAGCKQSPEQHVQTLCHDALRHAASNPTAAEIPQGKVKPWSDDQDNAEYVVRWDHGDGLRFQNAFGAMLDATAVCVADSQGVNMLSVDGKNLR